SSNALSSSCPFLADAGSCPGNCSGMEETTGAPSSFAVYRPRRLRASSRDGDDGVNRPPSTLTMLLSRHTRRREFITLASGAAATWTFAASAQQPDRLRRIGVLIGFAENDPAVQSWLAAFRGALTKLGWTEGSNLQVELRWAGYDPDRMKTFAKELVD